MSTAIRRTPLNDATVVGVSRLTPRMVRVTLAAQSMAAAVVRPAQDIELIVTDETGRRGKRRYTIRRHRPSGEIDLDVLVHGHGAGSTWAEGVTAGAPAQFYGPRGKLEIRDAGGHLFVGDEAAIPAFGSVIDALPPGVPVRAVIEVEGPEDEAALDLLVDDRAEVTWVHRAGAPAGRPELLAAALRQVSGPPAAPETVRAYLLGESRAVVALRPSLHAHGIADDRIFLKGYWNLGRAERAI